ncbi:hypothetical protein BKE30_00305 [Alkanindiges hydrocarboniclasticus]|jgi:hypothetical protein|uniref:Uncharacterized protein n=1 Tax=Alkanindiges hydrocarboniclasticus TaxID=1907941 RepID=A0A1S8CZQ0_9GAMM|nr:hypothetical protein [Alkanindiges hydrocarboniclasticus]ONG42285.1 hypothetical protein BKE30_00305 [Alkanindiges hydrocarboniclasticus]
MTLKAEIRSLLIQESVGLLSKEALIAKVDQKLIDISTPPSWLLDLSLGDYPSFEGNLDIITFPIQYYELLILIPDMTQRFKTGQLNFDLLIKSAYLILNLLSEDTDLYDLLNWITDEAEFYYTGMMKKQDVVQKINEALAEFINTDS